MQELVYNLVIFLVPLIMAVTVHEFAHVAVARWLGDDLGTRMGRFTLDPLRHIDPTWTVGLPAMLIVVSTLSGSSIPFLAAGKPAPYNPLRLDRKFGGKRIQLRFAELLVALAGPLSNLLLAFVLMAAMVALFSTGRYEMGPHTVVGLLQQFVVMNISLFVFNLVPIPPLDGSKILSALLPRQAARQYESISGTVSLVLFMLIILGGGALIGRMVVIVMNLMLMVFGYA